MTELASEFAAWGGCVKSVYVYFVLESKESKNKECFPIHMSNMTLLIPSEDPENPL